MLRACLFSATPPDPQASSWQLQLPAMQQKNSKSPELPACKLHGLRLKAHGFYI